MILSLKGKFIATKCLANVVGERKIVLHAKVTMHNDIELYKDINIL